MNPHPTPARAAIGIAIGAGTIAYICLHLFEPALSLTWSYSHLNRLPGALWTGLAAAIVLPLAFVRFSSLPVAERVTPTPSRTVALTAVLGFALIFLAAGWFFPSRPISIDTVKFAIEVWKGDLTIMRWYLATLSLTGILRVAEWSAPFPVPARDLVAVVNAVLSGMSYALLFGCARRLGRNVFEVGIIVALAWTAFGNLQLGFYYIDVYPIVQLAMALMAWTSLRVLADEGHPVWPVLIALVGPLFYVGLVLLVPSLLVVGIACLRRANGWRDLGVAVVASVLVAGCATLPGLGAPFAFGQFLARVAVKTASHLGYSDTSSLLPVNYMLSAGHVWEYMHTLLLIDGLGLLLCATAGLPTLARFFRGEFVTPAGLLIFLAGPVLFYAFVMDPLWGAYADWDLFSYAAVPTSLLGGYAFVVWGRETPRLRAALFGLLLAASLLHLGARLNALDVDRVRHEAESPSHVTS